jgi:ABC-type oligopeptide transport system substrate-binding subunit
VAWWHQAKLLASVQSDGYRAIKTLSVSNDGLTLTAIFSTPYAEWNKLFRDVEEPGAQLGCSWHDFLARPSLGPYEVASASNNRILLVSNPQWTLNPNRFSRINITDAYDIPTTPNDYYVGYDLTVTQSSVQAASSHPAVLSHIGTSSNLMEMTFAPSRPLTKRLYIREGVSLILNRQELVNNVFGAVTFSPSVAQSALYSQGQSAYPGGSGSGPSAQSTTTTVTSTQQSNNLLDCRVCALHLLEKAGYRHVGNQWQDASGAPLALRVVVGPSSLDHQVASEVVRQWRINGIASFVTPASSDQQAAYLASVDAADVAIFTHPTSTTASYTARSFAGPPYIDTYPSGIRSAVINRFFKASIQNFNPVTAQSTWLQIDQIVLNDFWVRPLFTAPSLVEWSNSVATVNGSVSVTGFVDQVTSWGIIQSGANN